MPSIADRVRGLIEASGLSQHAFAQRIGLDDSKMSKSLSGARRFSSLDLARIAEEYRVSVDWLISGEEPPLAVAARTTNGLAGEALTSARRYSTMRSDLSTIGYRQPWRPFAASSGSGSYKERGQRLAELAHAKLREANCSIFGGDLAAMVEDVFGADVAIVQLGEGFDGLAVSSEEVKLIVLASIHVPARQRFTLAHELGHLLAGDDQDIHLDRDIFDKAQSKDPTEMQANSFASALLMPEDVLRARLRQDGLDQQAFAELVCDLQVSPSALAFRLKELRIIDAGRCDRYKSMTGADAAKLAGRGEWFARLVTAAGTPRPPGILLRDTYAAYETGAATLRPYANLLGADVDELRDALESEQGTPSAP
ncbi:XRE family transcriptional regulator [Herbidospora sp. NBRC 101105]|uniref:helix-turn-helix domain-containing protein n=1 Tax=Herbidospora sp. NBRC 101105 TaxID=3032195 RepID=UPI002553D8C7|nr:XRE family transcriptional regulator [Herbidospora sp. NBRC 101105]